jgi:arylsulfatase A-like enzyme
MLVGQLLPRNPGSDRERGPAARGAPGKAAGMNRDTLAGVFCVAAWCALFFGLLSGAGLLALSFYEPPLSWFSLIGVNAHILWIEPAWSLLLNLLVAVGLSCGLLLARRLPKELVAIGVFSFLGFLQLALLTGRLHRLSAVVLAAGMSAVVCRRVLARGDAAMRWAARSLPALAGVWLLALAGCVFTERWQEKRALDGLPPAIERPNVLLIVADTLRADRMSAYGYPRPTTPFFERLAQESTLFSHAVATSSWTLPAHASLFTGLYPYQHGANGEALAEKHVTLAEVLRDRGFLTAAFVANTSFVHRRTGLAQGFARYEDLFGSPLDMAKRTVFGRRLLPRAANALGYFDTLGRKTAEDINRRFLAWLDARGNHARRPFFVFLNYMDTHDPYMPPREFALRFSAQADRLVRREPVFMDTTRPVTASAEQQKLESDAYDSSIAYLDAQLEKLCAALAERKLLDNTLVVITSDHGEALFEHGRFGHGSALHREQIHIPLLFRLPGRVEAGWRDPRAVDITAVPATILALLNVGGPTPGENLAPFGSGADAAETQPAAFSDLDHYRWVFINKPSRDIWVRSLVTPEWHFLRNADGSVELYDWKHDPAELNNLAATPQGEPVVQKFLGELSRHTSQYQVAQKSGR